MIRARINQFFHCLFRTWSPTRHMMTSIYARQLGGTIYLGCTCGKEFYKTPNCTFRVLVNHFLELE